MITLDLHKSCLCGLSSSNPSQVLSEPSNLGSSRDCSRNLSSTENVAAPAIVDQNLVNSNNVSQYISVDQKNFSQPPRRSSRQFLSS